MMDISEQLESIAPDLGSIILYQAEEGRTALDVQLKDETVWLSQQQMAALFGTERSVITKHVNNIFKTEELARDAVCAKFAHTAADNKTYQIKYYNLDVIIAVGYRVNAKRGTQFRIWATGILKDYLVRGYAHNQHRLAEKGVEEVRQMLSLLTDALEQHHLVVDEGLAVLHLVRRYATTWKLLLQFDENRLLLPAGKKGGSTMLEPAAAREAIACLRQELSEKGEATELFGRERGDSLSAILGAVYQTFGGQELYPSIEEKAAHLLYFVIKDHPFTDGNKRIGSFLFLLNLQMNGVVGAGGFDSKALVALALLTATSDPAQKELMIRLIVNLLDENQSRETVGIQHG